MLTFEQIKELVELVAERDLAGVELERSGFRLHVEGKKPPEVVAAAAPSPAQPAPAAPPAAPAAQPAGESVAPDTSSGEEANGEDGDGVPEGAHVLNSPIVGTFYRAPSPDADPYVSEGDRVKKGQVLCIVEAMKLMNEIEADVAGTVLEIYPKDAQAVEFGEPLFAIRPD